MHALACMGIAALMAACAGPRADAPDAVPPASGPPAAGGPANGAACLPGDALALYTKLSTASADSVRGELAVLNRRFTQEPTESNRLALVMALLAARAPVRDDGRLVRLLEGIEPAAGPCEVRELLVLVQRLVIERVRAVREEQRRGALALREEQRRSDGRIREEQDRAAELKRKLDAMVEVERKVRRDAPAPLQ